MENLNRVIACCLEHLRSGESQPKSLSKDLVFKSEKVIKRVALFCSFGSLSE